MKTCSVETCSNPHYAKGLCRSHYGMMRNRGTTSPPAAKHNRILDECSVDGCTKPQHSKELCQPHYRQMKRRERGLKKPGPKPDSTKIRSRWNPDNPATGFTDMRVPLTRTPRFRIEIGGQCRSCGTIYTEDTLISRPDLHGFACKPCMRNALRRADLKRKRLLEDAICDPSISPKSLRDKYGSHCFWCDKETTKNSRGPLMETIDHIVAVSLGGNETWDNVVLSCKSCNSTKNNRTLEAWLEICSERGFDIERILASLGEIRGLEEV